MPAEGTPDPAPRRPRYQPLAWLIALLVVALVLAIAFAHFLIAPIAILIFFYVGISAIDRARRR